MLSSDVEMGDMAIALLLVGLAGYTPCQKGMAIESAIQAIAEKRLPLAKSASWMSMLMTSNYVIPKRWVKTLGEIANVSTMHEHYVRELITEALQFDSIDSPAGLGNILEFVYELYIKTNETLNSDVAKRFLKANKKGGKKGKFAKLLLKL